MNFRLLKNEELEPLTKEFVMYLAANGVDADLWEQIKAKDNCKASVLLKNFSDSVWFKIYANKKYMELIDQEATYHLDFQQDKIIVLRIGKLLNNIGMKEQAYIHSREEDMYQWAEQGAVFSDGLAYREALMLWYNNRTN
jgi:hypothetical protein